jgi:hypothetical protein
MVAGSPFVLFVTDEANFNGTIADNQTLGSRRARIPAPLGPASRGYFNRSSARVCPLNPGICHLANNRCRNVLNGNNTYVNQQDQTVQGYSAATGFDLESGWAPLGIADFPRAVHHSGSGVGRAIDHAHQLRLR